MRVIRDCQAYVVILKMAIFRIFYPGYVYLLGSLRPNTRNRKTKKVNIVAEMWQLSKHAKKVPFGSLGLGHRIYRLKSRI